MKNELREKPIIVIVKKSGGHGHHGGAWKVAFADFMTAMMAMFLVLWIVGQSTDVRSAIAGHFQDPLGRASEFGSSIMPGEGAARPPLVNPLTLEEITDIRIDRLGRLARRIRERLVELPDFSDVKDQIEVHMTDDGLRIELLEDTTGIFFESASATPQADGRTVLLALGAELSRMPNHVLIEGHTDARGFARGGRYSNWELSTERANAARRLLIEGGLPEEQIDEVRGYADRQLRTPDHPDAAENRRVTITVKLGTDAFTQLGGSPTLAAEPDDSTPAQPGGGAGRGR